jgi:hypothetical protein
MRSAILELAKSWDPYWRKKTTDKSHPVHKLILQDIPNKLKSWHKNPDKYIFKGSDGQGNILRTPWIATFNPEITKSATTGFYPVYLFRDNMKEMVLAIGFGATQFEEKYGRGVAFFEEVSRAVHGMQTSSSHLLRVLSPSVRDRLSLKPAVLDSSKDFKLRAYEKCSIYSLSYLLERLPSDEELRSDYLEVITLYNEMSGSLLIPSEEDYVLEEITAPVVPDDFETLEFVPAKRKKRKSGVSSDAQPVKRYSKSSDKVGRVGEEYVFNAEKDTLMKAGRKDLASKVIWHRNYPENRTPGWDITSFETNGEEKFIEVKATTGKSITSVILTPNEWKMAQMHSNGNKYQIYLVSKVLAKPQVHTLKNPAKWVSDGILDLEVDSYLLYLSKESSEE